MLNFLVLQRAQRQQATGNDTDNAQQREKPGKRRRRHLIETQSARQRRARRALKRQQTQRARKPAQRRNQQANIARRGYTRCTLARETIKIARRQNQRNRHHPGIGAIGRDVAAQQTDAHSQYVKQKQRGADEKRES